MSDFPVISDDPDIQDEYESMRRAGESHNIAELLATRITPGVMTDAVFLEGHCNGSQFSGQELVGNKLRREAEAAGVSTTGKVYMSGLARYPGDPEAWVSGRGDVQRVCEARGWGCEGSVNCKVRPEEPVNVGIAEDLVDQYTRDALEAHPEPRTVNVAELREEIRQKHQPHWSK